jgi:hypothetical protein
MMTAEEIASKQKTSLSFEEIGALADRFEQRERLAHPEHRGLEVEITLDDKDAKFVAKVLRLAVNGFVVGRAVDPIELDEVIVAFGRAVTETPVPRPDRIAAESVVRDFLLNLRNNLEASRHHTPRK